MSTDRPSNPIVVEQTYSSPVAAVWKAITDRDQMRQWFFETIGDFKPEVGCETRFVVHSGGQDYPHWWKVTGVIPEKIITYDWRYPGYPGQSTVSWELTRTAGGTTLLLTHAGIETFPRDNPVFSREAGLAGWTWLVQQSLKTFLEDPDT